MVAKSKKDSSVTKLTETQIWLAEKAPTGFLVALWIDSETASKLALTGGESSEQLHITLAYCGDSSEINYLDKARALVAIAEAVRYWSPIEGKVAGYGRFEASDTSDAQDVFHALVDIPQLADLRQCVVNALGYEGIAVSTNHGYTPHITLAYLDPEAPNPVDSLEPVDLKFETVTIMDATTRMDLPFWQEIWPEATISMSESTDLPLDAPLGAIGVRAMFGDFNKEWISFLPKPNKYFHEKFGEMDLTSSTYEEMIRNFNDYVYKQDLPIRATHTPSDGGAIGWIRRGGMRLAQDGSIEVRPEWNELGKGLVADNRFQHVSAEYCKMWTNPVTQEKIPNVAVGLALVTRPHFKTDVLNPLSESEALAFSEAFKEDVSLREAGGLKDLGDIPVDLKFEEKEGIAVTDEEKKIALAEARALVLAADKEETDRAAAAAATKLAEDSKPIVLTDLTTVVITAEQRSEERRQFADLTTRVELAERRATTAEANMKQIETDRRKEKFLAEVTGHSAENGVAWFGSIEANVSHLVSLAEQFGDNSAQVQYTVAQKRTEASAIERSDILKPLSTHFGEDGASVQAQVQLLAENVRRADPKLSPEQAEVQALRENPELYLRYINGRK